MIEQAVCLFVCFFAWPTWTRSLEFHQGTIILSVAMKAKNQAMDWLLKPCRGGSLLRESFIGLSWPMPEEGKWQVCFRKTSPLPIYLHYFIIQILLKKQKIKLLDLVR